ncbi:hypothetical protein ABW636_02890 [Aquimarina sp. 2201CG1-2-11]|uniref:hypothetical protein n=1 Tax=Aquimarina discodermiae TaxID=3231043 RepID=UPI0034623C88
MKETILNLGNTISKKEQGSIKGGFFNRNHQQNYALNSCNQGCFSADRNGHSGSDLESCLARCEDAYGDGTPFRP